MSPFFGKRLNECTSNVKERPSRLRIWLCQYGDDRAIVKPRERLNHRRAKERQRFDCLRSPARERIRSEEHTSELQSLMRISYAVFCLKKKNTDKNTKKIQARNNNKTKDKRHKN